MQASANEITVASISRMFLSQNSGVTKNEHLQKNNSNVTKGEWVIWASIFRNETILLSVPPNNHSFELEETIRGLMNRSFGIGWDAWSLNSWRAGYKGLRFHFCEETEEELLRVWTFACVYDSTFMSKKQAQMFVEQKMVAISEMFREADDTWKYGSHMACQEVFAPIMEQRMKELASVGGVALFDDHMQLSSVIMESNRDLMNRRIQRRKDAQASKAVFESGVTLIKSSSESTHQVPPSTKIQGIMNKGKVAVASHEGQAEASGSPSPAKDKDGWSSTIAGAFKKIGVFSMPNPKENQVTSHVVTPVHPSAEADTCKQIATSTIHSTANVSTGLGPTLHDQMKRREDEDVEIDNILDVIQERGEDSIVEVLDETVHSIERCSTQAAGVETEHARLNCFRNTNVQAGMDDILMGRWASPNRSWDIGEQSPKGVNEIEEFLESVKYDMPEIEEEIGDVLHTLERGVLKNAPVPEHGEDTDSVHSIDDEEMGIVEKTEFLRTKGIDCIEEANEGDERNTTCPACWRSFFSSTPSALVDN